MRYFLVSLLLLVTGLISGCASSADLSVAKQDIINNDNKIAVDISKEHLDMMAGDSTGLSATDKQLKQDLVAMQKALADEVQRANDKEAAIGNIVTEGLGTAGEIAAGNVGGAVKNSINVANSLAIVTARTNAKEVSDLIKNQLNDRLSETTRRVDDTKSQVAKQSDQVISLQNQQVRSSAQIDVINVQLAQLQKIQQELQTNPKAGVADLDAELQKRGLTRPQIDELHKEFTPDQIIAALIAGAAGVGGGGLFSRLGKSRGADAVATVEKSVSGVADENDQQNTKIALLENALNDLKNKAMKQPDCGSVQADAGIASLQSDNNKQNTNIASLAEENDQQNTKIALLEAAIENLKNLITDRTTSTSPSLDSTNTEIDRAMQQFDGRLGALETLMQTLVGGSLGAGKRTMPRPESL